MGPIVLWALIRILVMIPILWVVTDYMDYRFWWSILFLSIYVVIIHPAVVQYRLFIERNIDIIKNSLCSSCEYFDATAVICVKHDKHPSKNSLPCEGQDWEPRESTQDEKETLSR